MINKKTSIMGKINILQAESIILHKFDKLVRVGEQKLVLHRIIDHD